MAKESGMSVSDMPMSKKLEFEDFMNYIRDCVEFNGVTYTLKDKWQNSIENDKKLLT